MTLEQCPLIAENSEVDISSRRQFCFWRQGAVCQQKVRSRNHMRTGELDNTFRDLILFLGTSDFDVFSPSESQNFSEKKS